VIYDFLDNFYEGDYDNGMPSLTPLHEDAIIFNLHDAKAMLDKLHKLGFTGLQIKEYVKGLYDWEGWLKFKICTNKIIIQHPY